MDDRINNILCKLQNGKIDVDKTVNDINCLEGIHNDYKVEEKHQRRASKIKIYIDAIDDKSGKRIKLNLPGFPFWLIKLIGVPIIKAAINSSTKTSINNKKLEISDDNIEKIEKAKNLGFKAHDITIKTILDQLSQMPPFEIVSVDSVDTKVHIYTK